LFAKLSQISLDLISLEIVKYSRDALSYALVQVIVNAPLAPMKLVGAVNRNPELLVLVSM